MKKTIPNKKGYGSRRNSRVTLKGVAVLFVLAFLFVFTLFSLVGSVAKVVFISSPNDLCAGLYTSSPLLADKLTAVFNGDIDLYDGDTEVYLPIGCTMDNHKCYSVVSKTGSGRLYGYQCYIYANAVYNYLFKEYAGHGTNLDHSVNVLSRAGGTASYEQFKNAGVMCGAYLRTTANSDGSYNGSNGHSLIVLSYNENEITYIEGNGEGVGLVRGAILSWSDFNARQLSGRGRVICHVTQPTASYYQNLYGSSTITVKFDLNGGVGTAPDTLHLRYGDSFTLPNTDAELPGGYRFTGWTLKRTDADIWADTNGGWSTGPRIASGAATKKVFIASKSFTFDTFFIMSGGTHTTASSKFVFYANYDKPSTPTPEPTPRPTGAFTMNASLTKSAGDTYEITLDVTNNPGVAYLELSLDIPKGLEIVSVKNGSVLGGMYYGTGSVITWKMAGDSFTNGKLVTVNLKQSGTVAAGSKVTLSVAQCCGEPGDVEFTLGGSPLALK
ncbi:MAG: hypothetical protein J6T65_01915 [Clostridia bacterium]|nr:hypothetical protein [Clostridia bacterium]MBP5765908.1 hypothetical protein [Clostridia bacterium]